MLAPGEIICLILCPVGRPVCLFISSTSIVYSAENQSVGGAKNTVSWFIIELFGTFIETLDNEPICDDQTKYIYVPSENTCPA